MFVGRVHCALCVSIYLISYNSNNFFQFCYLFRPSEYFPNFWTAPRQMLNSPTSGRASSNKTVYDKTAMISGTLTSYPHRCRHFSCNDNILTPSVKITKSSSNEIMKLLKYAVSHHNMLIIAEQGSVFWEERLTCL